MKNELVRIRSIGLVVLIATALGFTACSHKASSDEGGGGAADAMTVEVTLAQVARADISQMLTVTGTLSALPNQDVRVSALVPGRVAQLRVAEGDHVEIGQVMAKLDDRPYRDQLQQAEAATAQARANLQNARLSFERNQTLFERGIAARKDLEDARTQQSVAQAALRQAEAALELAHLQVARTEILSPLNGMVVKRFVNVGEQVDGTAAQPVVEVANLNQVELFGNLPAIYLAKIHVGQTLPVTSDALPGKTLSGRVVAVSPAVDPSTNVGTVRIRIANPQHLLRLGVFSTAQIAIETHANALTVPPQAIYRDEQGQPRVFRVDKDNATAVPVTLGIETPDRVELVSGVNEGETVILTGGYGLGDKAKIKVKS